MSRPWTLAETREPARRFEDGESDEEIARAMQRTARAVANKRHDQSLRRYSRDTRRAVSGDSKIAQIYADALDVIEILARSKAHPSEITEEIGEARARARKIRLRR